MTKVLYCNDLVPGCKSEEESGRRICGSPRDSHNLPEIPDEILAMISKAIHEVRGRAANRG